MDTSCWTIIGALATTLVAVAGWGVKQAKSKEKILREWLDESRDQLKMFNLVHDANRTRRN